MFRDRVLQHYREKGYTLRERVRVRGASGTVHACDLVAQGPLGNLVVQFEDYGGFEGPELDAVRRIARDVGATPVVAAEQVGQALRRHADQAGVVVMDAEALARPALPPVEVAVGSQEPAYPPWPGQKTRAADGDALPRAWPDDGRARPAVSPRMDPGEVDDLVSEWSRPEPPRPTRRQDPGFWKYGDDDAGDAADGGPDDAVEAPAPKAVEGFSWLGGDRSTASAASVAPGPGHAPSAPAFGGETSAPAGSPHPAGAPARARTAQTARVPDLRWLAGLAVAGACAGAAFLGLGVLFGVL